MLRLLVLCDHYLPSYKAGGPIRSLASLVRELGGEIEFRILTRDRDFGEAAPLPGITAGAWQEVEGAQVCYLSRPSLTISSLRRWIRSAAPQAMYLNSFFSFRFSILPLLLRRLGAIPRVPTVIAPRGELMPGALGLKRTKKRLFLAAARLLGLHKGLTWHATSSAEAAELHARWRDARVVEAQNLSAARVSDAGPHREGKPAGSLRVVFVSRVTRMKNLDVALRALQGVRGEVQFDIYGPQEDAEYLAECEKLVRALPLSTKVTLHGGVPHHLVHRVLQQSDLFFLPTRGENFGHSILEALGAGCPVLISDATPWRNLHEKGVGWDLPAEDLSAFRARLQACVDMGPDEHRALCDRALAYSRTLARDRSALVQYRELFDRCSRPT